MPFPLKSRPNQQIAGGWRSLYHCQECATGIAAVANAWASVEGNLASTFGAVMGQILHVENTPEGIFNLRLQMNPVALASMDALDSLSARLSVVKKGIATKVPQHLLEEFEALAQKLRKAAGARNEVVHSQWGITEEYPNDLILMGPGPDCIRYTSQCFQEIADRIDRLNIDLMQFSQKCHAAAIPQPPRPASFQGPQ